ncbi:hypothetical protein E2C01_084971 [Portunus trituberculatus]|uniref:Uncharacterized protein n=1 Tax=Portunus trituberculatus TaxID=210409 RepID=A0A5B7J5E8_PORTR|nr:hypothetical protein [Portunus trituberculatus]
MWRRGSCCGVREATGCVVLTDIIAVATTGPPSCPALTPAVRPPSPSQPSRSPDQPLSSPKLTTFY